MSVTKRGHSYQAYVKVGDNRLRKTFSTKGEAEIWEVQARQALKLGKSVPVAASANASVGLGKAAEQCYLLHWKGSKSEHKVIQNIKLLEDFFGKSLPITSITTDSIDDFILTLKRENKANGTINRKLATLSKILRNAHEKGHINKMPVFHRQKEGKNRIRWLTKQEENQVVQLMEQWGMYDLKDAFVVSIDTGLRVGELVSLKHSDILKEGVLVGESKNGESRLVPLTTRARDILESRKVLSNLFPKGTSWMRSPWDRVRNHLELDDVVWHTLRHTTCSRLVQGGVPLTHVKEWMGHKTIITTMRYAHLAPNHLQEMVGVLES
jgi:site-specific recombinase XerD